MSLSGLINLVVALTLIEMMILVGLRLPVSKVIDTARNWPLVMRAMAANYVLVPGLAVLLLAAFRANPMVSVGILALAVCPAAPFGPSLVGLARGDVPQAVGLMVILSASSAIVSPLLLQALLPWIAEGGPVRINAISILGALLTTQLLPLLLGVLVQHRYARVAKRLLGPLELAAMVLGLTVIALILAT